MNREIKFRFWDNEEKVYYGVDNLYFPLGTKDGKDICITTTDGCEWRSIDEGSLEQYTGLKDKNGVDIYENDNVINGNGKEREVGYNERRCQFGLYSRQLNCWITNELLTNDEWEVAGTIHE